MFGVSFDENVLIVIIIFQAAFNAFVLIAWAIAQYIAVSANKRVEGLSKQISLYTEIVVSLDKRSTEQSRQIGRFLDIFLQPKPAMMDIAANTSAEKETADLKES